MKAALAIAQRELASFFKRPAAWVFLAAFLVVGAVLGLRPFFERNVADLRDYFAGLRYALVLLAPAAAMRLWAEEQRAGTIEFLFSLPIRPWQAVLGKFLSGAGVLACALVLSTTLPLSLSPFAAFDPGQIAAGYLGAFLLGLTYLALGMVSSALSSSQEVAFLVGALACLLLNLLSDPVLVERAARYLPRAWVLVAASFGIGEHYEALTRGVLESRSLAYFMGVTLLALFWNVLLVERRARARGEVLLAGLLSLIALIAWVSLTHQRPLSARWDLTSRKANSLSPATEDLLGRIKGRVTVRAYLSLDAIPEAAQPALRRVRDLLDDLERAGGGRVEVEVIDPTTPELQEDAERQGVKRFELSAKSGDGQLTRTVYAGLVLFYGGRPPLAIPFAFNPRGGSLETEVAVHLRTLLTRRPRVGVAGVGAKDYAQALSALKAVATVDTIDLARDKAVPESVDLLIYAAPIPPREREVYAIDQHLAAGGRALLLVEGHASAPGAPWTRTPVNLGALGRALEAWGVRVEPKLVVQEAERVWTIQTERGPVQARYPWFVQPSGADNPQSPVASGLGRLLLPYASELKALDKAEVLLQTEPAWSVGGEREVHPTKRVDIDLSKRRPRVLALGRRAELRSPWAKGPGPVLLPEAKDNDDPLATPLTRPTAAATLAVVGDADFLRPAYLREGQNVDLLLNLVDWCLDNGSLASIRGRGVPPPLTGTDWRTAGLDREAFAWRLNLALPFLVLFGGLGALAFLRSVRGRRATGMRERLAHASIRANEAAARAAEPESKAGTEADGSAGVEHQDARPEEPTTINDDAPKDCGS